MSKKIESIGIVGAGLVGSLLSIYMIKRGYKVSLFEHRPDMRLKSVDGGRSINMAMSNRGIRALEQVGLADELKRVAIPMHGRIMHDMEGNLTFQPYGKKGQYINSISRGGLNVVLMNEAERLGVKIYFNHHCVDVNSKEAIASFQMEDRVVSKAFDVLVGADGSFSAVRNAIQKSEKFKISEEVLDHGYKELTIPPGPGGSFLLDKNALHIWPRSSFMLIALPNPDGNFTCTLFFANKGKDSFAKLTDEKNVQAFFQKYFPDAQKLMPYLLDDFKSNPTSSLVTIRCSPWTSGNTFLIGDAAHGIVPFYGQGMNAGFEDCFVLNSLLDQYGDDWGKVLLEYQQLRKPDADAIAQLALDNFIEMRDHVGDEEFLLRKKIEAKLHELYPDRWIPLYAMVTFQENMRYSEAAEIGRRQKQIMDEVMETSNLKTNWESLNFEEIVSRLS